MDVKIARRCHCVIKNNLKEVYRCKDRQTAQKYAKKLCQYLENHNCNAHSFFIRESDDEIVIDSKFNVEDISI